MLYVCCCTRRTLPYLLSFFRPFFFFDVVQRYCRPIQCIIFYDMFLIALKYKLYLYVYNNVCKMTSIMENTHWKKKHLMNCRVKRWRWQCRWRWRWRWREIEVKDLISVARLFILPSFSMSIHIFILYTLISTYLQIWLPSLACSMKSFVLFCFVFCFFFVLETQQWMIVNDKKRLKDWKHHILAALKKNAKRLVT